MLHLATQLLFVCYPFTLILSSESSMPSAGPPYTPWGCPLACCQPASDAITVMDASALSMHASLEDAMAVLIAPVPLHAPLPGAPARAAGPALQA